VTPTRSLLMLTVAVALLIGARPSAGDKQFPRGLMSSEPKAPGFCTIETRPLSFGTYDPLAETEVDAVGQIIYICGRGTGVGPGRFEGILIEMAQGSSNSYAPRSMAGTDFGSRLNYNIYLDPLHRIVWGTGVGRTRAYLNREPPTETPVVVFAYGRIFRGQDVPAGIYVDDVPVRIQF